MNDRDFLKLLHVVKDGGRLSDSDRDLLDDHLNKDHHSLDGAAILTYGLIFNADRHRVATIRRHIDKCIELEYPNVLRELLIVAVLYWGVPERFEKELRNCLGLDPDLFFESVDLALLGLSRIYEADHSKKYILREIEDSFQLYYKKNEIAYLKLLFGTVELCLFGHTESRPSITPKDIGEIIQRIERNDRI